MPHIILRLMLPFISVFDCCGLWFSGIVRWVRAQHRPQRPTPEGTRPSPYPTSLKASRAQVPHTGPSKSKTQHPLSPPTLYLRWQMAIFLLVAMTVGSFPFQHNGLACKHGVTVAISCKHLLTKMPLQRGKARNFK